MNSFILSHEPQEHHDMNNALLANARKRAKEAGQAPDDELDATAVGGSLGTEENPLIANARKRAKEAKAREARL